MKSASRRRLSETSFTPGQPTHECARARVRPHAASPSARAGPVASASGRGTPTALSVPPTITANVAIIGLGTGSIACYSAPGERWTFYEVDPTVERIARDPRLFTYLRDCRGEFSVVLGDARLKLERAPDRRYGLIVADAFSSDAVPVHLLTREALELYRSKLVERGIIGFNVTNSYVALEPVLGNLAHEAGLACVGREDRSSREDGVPQTDASDWVLMTGHRRDFGAVASGGQWHDCRRSPGARAWTDDFSNLLGALDLDR